MRLSVLAYATVAAGLGVAVAGAYAAVGKPLTALALLGAAALAAELLEEPEGGRVRAPVGPGVFRVASGVDIAAVIVLGPWRGALVAGAAALLARLVRGPWRLALFQASAFALAALAAGYAFVLGGGTPGELSFPDDLVPLTLLAVAYLIVSRGLLQVVGDLEVLQPDFPAAAAEAGLGAVIALCAIGHPWDAVVVIPVAFAVNEAHARVRRSRLETLHALETFANIVDERDPYTYRHSMRVAGLRRLARPRARAPLLRHRPPALGRAPARPRQGRRRRGRARQVRKADARRVGRRLASAAAVRAAPAPLRGLRERGARGRVPPRALRRQGATTRSRRATSRSPRTSSSSPTASTR